MLTTEEVMPFDPVKSEQFTGTLLPAASPFPATMKAETISGGGICHSIGREAGW